MSKNITQFALLCVFLWMVVICATPINVVSTSALMYDTDVKIGDRLVYAYHEWNFTTNAWDPTQYRTYNITDIKNWSGKNCSRVYADFWSSTDLLNLTGGRYSTNVNFGILSNPPELILYLIPHGLKVGDYAQYYFNESLKWKGKNETFESFAINVGYGIALYLRNQTDMVYGMKYLYSTTGILLRNDIHWYNIYTQEWIIANMSTAAGIDESSVFGSKYGETYTDYKSNTINGFPNFALLSFVCLLGIGSIHWNSKVGR